MKHAWLAGLLIAVLPTLTFADHGGRGWDHGSWDRHSHGFFDVSIGVGGRGWFGGFGYRDYGYVPYRPVHYYYPSVRYYSAPAVVYQSPVYVAPAPVVVSPAPSYYYSCPPTRYYYASPPTYYYGR